MKDDTDERPWTEAEWEAFMKRADVRSARFGELLETLRDDPERDAKIGREMGWDRPDRTGAANADDPDGEFDPAELKDPDDEALAEAELEMKQSDAALRKIQAYSFALRAERQVRRILKRQLEKTADGEDRWGQIWMGPAMAGAKIAGGHGMGYDDDVLCGNIVNVRRGLGAVNEALVATRELHAEKQLSGVDAKRLLTILTDLKAKVEGWIAELRSRVWWE